MYFPPGLWRDFKNLYLFNAYWKEKFSRDVLPALPKYKVVFRCWTTKSRPISFEKEFERLTNCPTEHCATTYSMDKAWKWRARRIAEHVGDMGFFDSDDN